MSRSTPYHQSSNRLDERFNSTLASLLQSYIEEHEKKWDMHVPILMCAYHSTAHQSTGFTPNCLMLGREVMMPVDLTFSRRVTKITPRVSQSTCSTCRLVSLPVTRWLERSCGRLRSNRRRRMTSE